MKVIFFLLLLFFSCSIREEITQGKALANLSIAIIYKQNECKTQPNYFLPPPKKPFKYGVDACVFSIIKSPCPFKEYPIICIEIFKVDVKGVGPKIDKSILEL